MPGNDGSQVLGYLAGRYNVDGMPPRLGWLMGPRNWKRPQAFLPYALDNDSFSLREKWAETPWLEMLERARRCAQSPRWLIVPDVVGDPAGTLQRWRDYAPVARSYGWPLAIAVQDGMTAADVPDDADVVFVGGSTEWKWRTVATWCELFPRVHVGRVNSIDRLRLCEELGAESVDGTGWFRNPTRQDQLPALMAWLAGDAPAQLSLSALQNTCLP